MPYCIQRLDKYEYVILNREYRPIGFNEWFENNKESFNKYPVVKKYKGMNTVLKYISGHNLELTLNLDIKINKITKLWLYDDKNHPLKSNDNMMKYAKILEKLGKVQLK